MDTICYYLSIPYPKKNKAHHNWRSLLKKENKAYHDLSDWTFMPRQHWFTLAVNLSDVNICKWCSIYADNDCMCLPRLSDRMICIAPLPHRQFNSWLNWCWLYSCCSTCILNEIHEFLRATLNGCEGPAHWDHIRNRWFAWQGSRNRSPEERERCS